MDNPFTWEFDGTGRWDYGTTRFGRGWVTAICRPDGSGINSFQVWKSERDGTIMIGNRSTLEEAKQLLEDSWSV